MLNIIIRITGGPYRHVFYTAETQVTLVNPAGVTGMFPQYKNI